MSLEELHSTGLRDTTIKFILAEQLKMKQQLILSDKERALHQSLKTVRDAIERIIIKHNLEQDFWDTLAPNMPRDWANTWQK